MKNFHEINQKKKQIIKKKLIYGKKKPKEKTERMLSEKVSGAFQFQ